ncbi:MAG: type I-U CRISPR-associated protein Csb2 [Candidatus Eremiobacteraeota bacterium]|nr:type I-U CRISPR-associated protein Csb2 [Candidatus Eremiobacteraeota bacterium]
MIVISIKFIAGRYHATPYGKHVNEGTPEWPPSQYRFVRALIDTWKRKFCNYTEMQIAPILEHLSDTPAFYALPRVMTSHLRYFMSANTIDPSDKNKILDPFISLGKADTMHIGWHTSEPLSDGSQEFLSTLLSGLQYLGRSESWVQCQLENEWEKIKWNCIPEERHDDPSNPIDDEHRLFICCTKPKGEYEKEPYEIIRGKKRQTVSWLDAICYDTSNVLQDCLSSPPGMITLPYICKNELYGKDYQVKKLPKLKVNTVLYALNSKVLPRYTEAISTSEMVRRFLMGIHKKVIGDPAAVSEKFSGKTRKSVPLKGHKHCKFIVFDNDQDGKTDHIAVIAGEDYTDTELEALGRNTRIPQRGNYEINLVPIYWGSQEGVLKALPKKHKSSRRYKSVTPFLPDYHYRKGRGDFLAWHCEKLKKEFGLHGYPEPLKVSPLYPSGKNKWYDFRRARPSKNEIPRWGWGFEVEFENEQKVPFTIGHSSHYGMGLFLPD